MAQVFSCQYCEMFKNSFSIERLWWLILNIKQMKRIKTKSNYCQPRENLENIINDILNIEIAEIKEKIIYIFPPSVTFHIETSHLFRRAKNMAGVKWLVSIRNATLG